MTALIVLSGIFLIYTSTLYACENGHGLRIKAFDGPDVESWSMKIKISGNTESIMNIRLSDLTKLKNNPKGLREIFTITMKEREIMTDVMIYKDDSKDPVTYSWYSKFRRVRRHNKTELENNKYEKTGLTLKEIMDTTVKLIDLDQVTVNDKTVTVLERNIDIKEFTYP